MKTKAATPEDQPMCLQFARLRGVVLGALLALVCGGPAMADDTEIFTGTQSDVPPNIVFIFDTSGSMAGGVLTQSGRPSRLEIVQQVARDFINTASGINLGLMRYDSGAEGGMVTVAVAPIGEARNELIASINGFTASGNTPLSETLYEALQYYAGREVFFGDSSEPLLSVADSRGDDPDIYRSPIELSCQKNYVVYLTDGLPTSDNSADDEITGLDIGGQTFDSLVGADCDDDDTQDDNGRCLDDLAEFMFEADLRPDMEGDQNVVTHTIGFGPDVSGSTFLQEVAERGGGEAFSASDAAGLTEVLTTIANEIDSNGASFAAPSVAVNAFNRTETLDSVYFSVFQPSNRFHWPGNVKKYRVNNNQLEDRNGDPAIDDATGMLRLGSQSFWSDTADVITVGDEVDSVTQGGAAGRLTDPAGRRLFTFLESADLTVPTNAVDTANVLLTTDLLGLGLPGQPTVDQLINWTRGFDVKDEDTDGDFTEPRAPTMGDPLHGQSALVVYGGSADAPLAVMFAPTNDGVLHALDAENGEELWAFIPPELLGRLVGLYQDNLTTTKNYGLDGDIRAVRIDRNQNGIIEEGNNDRVLLFFGMRRGGNNYYALDVTDRENPEHLWTLGPTQLPGVGQTWSTPAFTRIQVSGSPGLPSTDNPDGFALVFGGGYDETQDNDLYNTDAVGNRIFIVDALSGERLWFAGGIGIGTPNLSLTGTGGNMNNSIPASVRVIDLDGDGFADRMYAADTGGRVWRFDIVTDTDPGTAGQQVPGAGGLVTGGVIASLGGAASPTDPTAARRFYETPDVALVQRRGAAPYFSISLGSGWRGHPLNTQIRDRFYSLRDYQPFLKFTQGDYNTRPVIADGGLADITTEVNPTVPVGSPGWRLELRLPGGFTGEKVLAESRTFNNIVFFPTYLPAGGTTSDPCMPTGRNRAYAVSVDDGRPVIDINRDQEITLEDRYTQLAQGGIAPEITFLFPGLVDGTGGEEEEEEDETQRRPVLCSSGGEFLPELCVDAGAPVRTYWRQGRAQP